MPSIGRPSKLTPERRDRIIALVRQGVFPEVAAQSVGVHPGTYYSWMAKGRAEREEAQAESADIALNLGLDIESAPSDYREFLEAVEQAVGAAQSQDELRLAQMAQAGSVTAQIERMKRRWRGHWGDRVDVSVAGGPEGAPVVIVAPEPSTAGWAPDQTFAEKVAGILQRAGKLPEVPTADVAAALLASPESLPAPVDELDGPAVATD